MTISTLNVCDKCPSSIRCRDSNLWPSELEPPPRTTRPGLRPLIFLFTHLESAWVRWGRWRRRRGWGRRRWCETENTCPALKANLFPNHHSDELKVTHVATADCCSLKLQLFLIFHTAQPSRTICHMQLVWILLKNQTENIYKQMIDIDETYNNIKLLTRPKPT